MLVLLDLLGAPDPTFFNYFENTQNWYVHLHNVEVRSFEDKKRIKFKTKIFRSDWHNWALWKDTQLAV